MCKWTRLVIVLVGLGLFQAQTAYAAMTHAAADHGLQGLIMEVIGSLIVLGVLIYTVKCFLWPGEKSDRHIKRRILHDQW